MLKPDTKRLKKGLWWQKNWGILEGCTKVSPGCRSCFAEDYARRFATTLPYLKGLTDQDGHWTGKVNLRPELLDLPLKTKTPAVWFVAERSDLFHEDVPDYFIHDALNAIGTASHHTFLLLTKRPDRMAEVLRDHYESALINPYTNLWVGTTSENQEQFNKRGSFLEQTPAAYRFISIEPMLEEINITRYLPNRGRTYSHGFGPIVWVICGCESGKKARPMRQEWSLSLMKQCRGTGAAFFLKQIVIDGKMVKAPELNGKQYLEWPE
jgi:protein gp37